jgi:dCMP deaminase
MENNNLNFPLIIGIVGDLSSGKETFARYLKENYNFEILFNSNYSLYDLNNNTNRDVTEREKILKSEKEEIDNIINEMNQKSTIESKTIKQKIRDVKSDYIVVYPYLSYEDYILLSNKSCFRLLNIVCPTMIRYKNYIKKNPDSSLENFLKIDYKISTCQSLNSVRNLAQFTIHNDSTLENFLEKINTLIIQLKTHFRPSWQDYFMSVAHIVAQRSNCVKQKVGTVIVRDGRILATGYNGTPAGIKNCYEGGCERCNMNVEQGLDLDKCFCLHSEENAVINIYLNELFKRLWNLVGRILKIVSCLLLFILVCIVLRLLLVLV